MDKNSPKEEIRGKRITLRRHHLGLAAEMFKYVEKDRKRLRKFLFWVDSIKSEADEINFKRKASKQWDNHEMFDYGIFRNLDQSYMGNIGIHSISWCNNFAELGYWICSEYEGNGYVSEAVALLEQELFGMGFHRIEIRCSTLNERSAKIPERLGYTLEGVLLENAFVNEQYYNTKVFGKLNRLKN